MLGGLPVELAGLDAFGEFEKFTETGMTFAQNARLKANHYSRLLNCWVIADDSGLEVDALDGAPGVQSARFAAVEGAQRDRANNEKLLELLKDVPPAQRTARFRCCLWMAKGDKILIEVAGIFQGSITDTPTGSNGFGYDPIFYVPDKDKTVAQMTKEEKNAISHRGRALRKLLVELSPFLLGKP